MAKAMDVNKRWWCVYLAAVGVVLMAAPAVTAREGENAPRRLTGDVLTADPLSTAQQQQIERYVDFWTACLCESPDLAKILEAKDMLVQPLNNRLLKGAARRAIEQGVSKRLPKCMEDTKQMSRRMNGLIVAAEIRVPETHKMLTQGLVDTSPAVRYWAAKATAATARRREGGRTAFNPDQEKELLKRLRQALTIEKSGHILHQMYAALGALTIPAAQASLLQMLDRRLVQHIQVVGPGLRADFVGLRSVVTRINVRLANDQPVGPQLKRLAAISGKYLDVISGALKKEQVPDSTQPICLAVIELVEKVFTDMAKLKGPPLLAPARAGRFAQLRLGTLDWVGTDDAPGILTKGKLAIPREQLRLPARAEPGPDPG